MTTKPKTRKAPAAKATAPISLCKIQEAHRHLWNAINLIKMTELTAKELVDGEIRGDQDYMHAIASASRFAVESILTAYDLIDTLDAVAAGEAS
jgi:hypothetical protein